jgi:hypothetical protein
MIGDFYGEFAIFRSRSRDDRWAGYVFEVGENMAANPWTYLIWCWIAMLPYSPSSVTSS